MNNLYYNVIRPLRDFIYPPVCLTCERLRSDQHSKVCAECWNSLTLVSSVHPIWQEIKGKFDQDGMVDDMLSCFLFEKEGKLQDIVHLLKYRGVRSVGVQLGRMIGGCVMRDARYMSADYLIPVPLHRVKQRERGYNQCEYLCMGISEITSIPILTSALVRKKCTQSQTRLNVEERRQNVEDAFVIDEKIGRQVNGKTVVLVDDVITTGSTVNACAGELRNNHARHVLAASAALAG